MAIDPGGNIWVADSGHNRVLEFNSERKYVRQFGTEGTGEGQFKGIRGIATNAAGDVYVTGSSRVQEFSPTGAYLRQFGSVGTGNGQFHLPTGIASDPTTGNLYVADNGNNRIEAFSSAGAFIAVFGSAGSGAGQFSGPGGVAVGSTGKGFILSLIHI